MLIAGCVWLGAKERGAFGFSNEKSLMYWPRTLSCAWLCWASGLCAAPPLPGVVIATTSHRLQLPQSAAWLTQGLGPDKDITAHAPNRSLDRRWVHSSFHSLFHSWLGS